MDRHTEEGTERRMGMWTVEQTDRKEGWMNPRMGWRDKQTNGVDSQMDAWLDR